MKQLMTLLLGCLALSSAQAQDIPYCSGTKVTGSKHIALQQVVQIFANENHCNIGRNCILNFDKVLYHIAWKGWCLNSTSEPRGTTFRCDKGLCKPNGPATHPITYYKDIS